MKIPNPQQATISDRKLVDYLLSSSHVVGRFKAAFFIGLGFGVDRVQELRSSLLELAAEDADSSESTIYGQKFVIRGTIVGPNGRSADIVTVWFLPTGHYAAHLVTAYPES